MSPIERAARALTIAQSGVDDFDGLDDAMQETLKDNARAVIEAIREPSDLMGLGLRKMDGEYRPGSHSATQIWKAMIDAALQE